MTNESRASRSLGKELAVPAANITRRAKQRLSNGRLDEAAARARRQRLEHGARPDDVGLVRLVERPEEVRVAWDGLTAFEARGFALHPDTGRCLGRVRLDEDGRLLTTVDRVGAPVVVELEGYAVAYRFAYDPRIPGPPPALRCQALRQDRRARVCRRVKVELGEALAPTRVLEFELRDVSYRGVGLICEAGATLLHPGQRLDDLVVRWKGGDVIRGSALVTHVSSERSSARIDGQGRCGLTLDLSPREDARWHALVEGLLHPYSVKGQIEPRALWNAYVDSGYLNLSGKSPLDFESDLGSFESSQAKLSLAPRVGAFFAAGDSSRWEAFAHQLQVWDRSWLWYHMCRLPTGRSLETSDDHVLVDLYSRAYDYVREQGAKWLVTYIQESAGYSRLVHYESALQLQRSGATCVVPFHAIEVSGFEAPAGGGFAISSATHEQADEVRALLTTRYPRLYLEATGLAEAALQLDGVGELWAAHGLERKREILVALRGGKIVASAVLDAATAGLHLYGLLDCARVFVHSGGGERAAAALLCAAQSWYRELGRARFAYFRDAAHDPVGNRPGCRSLGNAYLTVHSAELIPQLLERVFDLAAPHSSLPRRLS